MLRSTKSAKLPITSRVCATGQCTYAQVQCFQPVTLPLQVNALGKVWDLFLVSSLVSASAQRCGHHVSWSFV
jgi:hypothetical protein